MSDTASPARRLSSVCLSVCANSPSSGGRKAVAIVFSKIQIHLAGFHSPRSSSLRHGAAVFNFRNAYLYSPIAGGVGMCHNNMRNSSRECDRFWAKWLILIAAAAAAGYLEHDLNYVIKFNQMMMSLAGIKQADRQINSRRKFIFDSLDAHDEFRGSMSYQIPGKVPFLRCWWGYFPRVWSAFKRLVTN